MRKQFSIIKIILALSLLGLTQQGCITTQTPDAVAYKTIATITTTVDSARQAWNSFVAAGHATVDEVNTVGQAYTKYQSAVALAQVATISYKTNPDSNSLNAAITAVSDSSSALINVVNTFMGKK